MIKNFPITREEMIATEARLKAAGIALKATGEKLNVTDIYFYYVEDEDGEPVYFSAIEYVVADGKSYDPSEITYL